MCWKDCCQALMHQSVPRQVCVPSYQRRTASTLRISSRPSVWRTDEASSLTALAATGAQPAPPPILPPTATEQPEGAPHQTRARRPRRETNGTVWSLTSVMTSKLSAAVWTRREWRLDMASKGIFFFFLFAFARADIAWQPIHKWTEGMSWTDQMKVVLSTDLRFDLAYFPLIVKRTSLCTHRKNLNLLPQKHEVNKCTYADPVDDTQSVGYFLHFRGIHSLRCIFKVSFDFCTHLLAVSATAVIDVAEIQSLWEYFGVFIPSKTPEDPSEDCLCVFRRLRVRMYRFVLLFSYRSISFIHQENFGLLHLFHTCVLLWECNILLYIILYFSKLCVPLCFYTIICYQCLLILYIFCLTQTDQGNAVKTKILIEFKRLSGDCIRQSQLWLM